MVLTVTGITEIYKQGTTLEVAGTLAGGATNVTGLFFAGTGSYGQSFASGANEMSATVTASIDLTGKVVIFRFGHTTGLEVLETLANGGCVVRIGSSSANFEEYVVGGSGERNAGGCWLTVVIDPSLTGATTTGTPDMTAATFFAIETSLSGEAGGDTDNQFLDMITVVDTLTVTGTSTAFWADMAAWSDTNKYDIIRDIGGVYIARCHVEIDSTGVATTISDKGSTVAFAPDEYYNGTIFVDSIAGANMGFSIVQNGAGAVNVTFGEKLGSLGSNGVQFIGESTMVFDISDTGVATAHLYGCVIKGAIAPFLHDSGSECISTTFNSCGEITTTGQVLDTCIIQNAVTATEIAALQLTALAHVPVNTSFISGASGHAIELITTTGTYVLSGNTFVSYGAIASNDAAVYNNTFGAVILSISGGGSTPTYRNGTSATTTVSNALTFAVTVTNKAGNALQGISIRFEELNGTLIANGITNASGKYSASDTGGNRTIVTKARNSRYDFQETNKVVTGDFDTPITLIRDTTGNPI